MADSFSFSELLLSSEQTLTLWIGFRLQEKMRVFESPIAVFKYIPKERQRGLSPPKTWSRLRNKVRHSAGGEAASGGNASRTVIAGRKTEGGRVTCKRRLLFVALLSHCISQYYLLSYSMLRQGRVRSSRVLNLEQIIQVTPWLWKAPVHAYRSTNTVLNQSGRKSSPSGRGHCPLLWEGAGVKECKPVSGRHWGHLKGISCQP